MYPMARLLILICLSLLTAQSGAQTMVMNERCALAVDHLLNLDRDSAMILIRKEEAENPANAMVHYLYNLSDFLTTVVTEDEDYFNEHEEQRNARIKAISKVPSDNPYRKFALAEVNLQWAFSRLRFKEYFKAAIEINRAFHLLEENIVAHPDFLPNKKGIGLLHALIGTVPDQYRWATNLMGVNGTVSGGLSELRQAVQESHNHPKYAFLEKESLFLYSFIVLNLTSDKSELNAVAGPLDRLAMQSPLIAFAKASVLAENGKTLDAISLLEECGYEKRNLRFHYLDHLLGSYQLYSMNRKCERALSRYASNFKGKSYLKANQLMLAYHRLIFFNSEEMYQSKLAEIVGIGSTMLDEDKQAQKAFEKGDVPNLDLLKSRLQFDGGFLEEALSTLKNADQKSFSVKDKLELDYRTGRVYHKMKDHSKAISFYKKTVNHHSVTGTYFPANASLKLGEIFEHQNDQSEALKWYVASMEYDDHEYENSIAQKAKAGISRLD
ncbi:MAG: tetratricopeptide (TPR) repeat protein [Granulosicoccus sp.]